jgi:hypothetical protein
MRREPRCFFRTAWVLKSHTALTTEGLAFGNIGICVSGMGGGSWFRYCSFISDRAGGGCCREAQPDLVVQ